MSKKLRIGLLISLICFIGCSGLEQRMYQSPTSGDVAFIRVVDSEGLPFPKNSISVATYEEPETCTRRYFLQHYLQEPSVDYIKIKAGEPFSMSLHWAISDGSGYTFCSPAINFQPEAGRYYTAKYIYSKSNGSCYLPLISSGSPSMHPSRVEKPRAIIITNGFTENSSFCKSK